MRFDVISHPVMENMTSIGKLSVLRVIYLKATLFETSLKNSLSN